MIKILAWLLLILLSPLIIIIGSLVSVSMLINTIICEMEKILKYQILPYITWKIKSVRERFRKKDSN
jgi:ABC-type multidrug transport system permease subunit